MHVCDSESGRVIVECDSKYVNEVRNVLTYLTEIDSAKVRCTLMATKSTEKRMETFLSELKGAKAKESFTV